MQFSGGIEPGSFKFNLYHRDGSRIPFTGAGPNFDGTDVQISLPALDEGTYVVVWSSIGVDGHLAAGQSHFSIGIEESGEIGIFVDRASRIVSAIDDLTRWILYGALAVTLGALWCAAVRLPVRPQLVRWAGAAITALTAFRFLLVSTRVGGNPFTGAAVVLGTMPGALGWLLLLSAGIALVVTGRAIVRWAALTAGFIGSGLAGHLANERDAELLVPLIVVHLVAASFWVGAPAALLLSSRGRNVVSCFAYRFTPWAFGAVAALGTSGVGLAVMRTNLERTGGLSGLIGYQYGTILVAKWVLLAAVIGPLGGYHMVRSLAEIGRRVGARYDRDVNHTGGPNVPEYQTDIDNGTQKTESEIVGRRSLLVETASLAVVLGLGSMLAGLSPTPPLRIELAGNVDMLAAPSSFDACISGQAQTDEFLCVVRYFESLAANQGMPVALKEVTERWLNGDQWMLMNCHSIGHKLGRLGYRSYGSIPAAFQAGSDPCDYGYLHGVIEGASAGFTDDDLRAAMTTLCEGTGDAIVHTYRQCIHGLGHAAARRVNNDLARGMDFCREFWKPSISLRGSSDLESLLFNLCVTGVSMEWNTQPKAQLARELPVGHPETLLGLCTTLDEIFQHGCIEYGTSAMGGILEREIQARDWCDENLKDPLPCYQSIGRDVIWSPHISDEQAMEVCTGGRQGIYAEECITRALGSVGTITLDAYEIDRFCPVVPVEYQYLCPIVRDAMVTQIEQTVRGFIVDGDGGNRP